MTRPNACSIYEGWEAYLLIFVLPPLLPFTTLLLRNQSTHCQAMYNRRHICRTT